MRYSGWANVLTLVFCLLPACGSDGSSSTKGEGGADAGGQTEPGGSGAIGGTDSGREAGGQTEPGGSSTTGGNAEGREAGGQDEPGGSGGKATGGRSVGGEGGASALGVGDGGEGGVAGSPAGVWTGGIAGSAGADSVVDENRGGQGGAGNEAAGAPAEAGRAGGSPTGVELDCSNGTDDDHDGDVDCADSDCDGLVCRSAVGPCDLAEVCSDGECPANAFVEIGAVCREAAGPCDRAETCFGTTGDCPQDEPEPEGTVCREAAGPCDVAETCDGASTACPDDRVAKTDVVCRDADGECDVADHCDGVNTACPADAVQPEGTECRSTAGPCDVAETCDGASPACPEDEFAGASTACREAAGDCDVEERCAGDGVTCPADTYQSEGTVCRAAAGTCDSIAEECTGTEADCPADESSCEPTQYCDGASCLPKQANGDSCFSNVQCASGHCVDGFCCNSTCIGPCQACNVAGSQGVCTPQPEGTDPEGGCGSYYCDGAGACDTRCNILAVCGPDCKPDHYCNNRLGLCAASKTEGGSCKEDCECLSGHCADGVCCNTACDGPCEACNLTDHVGTCSAHAPQTDPEGDCGPYNCNGARACETSCSGGACSQDCSVNNYCNGSSCASKRSLGASCNDTCQCASGYCVDGVCCNTTCAGGCQACNLAGSVGTCSSRPRGQDPEEACGAYTCNGYGACLTEADPATSSNACSSICSTDCKSAYYCSTQLLESGAWVNRCVSDFAQGHSCQTDCQCLSGHCVDGVCCNSDCAGLCRGCNMAGHAGVCSFHISDLDNECGNYLCDGNGHCRTSCSNVPCDANACKASAFCNGDTKHCDADLAAGSLCVNDCMCSSNVCNIVLCQ
jgi:hypothetical protein